MQSLLVVEVVPHLTPTAMTMTTEMTIAQIQPEVVVVVAVVSLIPEAVKVVVARQLVAVVVEALHPLHRR
jgi:hypothetical protein